MPSIGLSLSRWLVPLGLLIFADQAQAEQRELQLGLQPLYGLTYIDERNPHGGGGGAFVSFGLTDAVAVQLSGGVTVHPLEENKDKMQLGGRLVTYAASAGIVYALDIVRIVPFFSASIGLLGTTQPTAMGDKTALNLGVGIGLGADYMLNRRWALGAEVRYHAFLTDLGRLPLYLTVGPRLLVRFGL